MVSTIIFLITPKLMAMQIVKNKKIQGQSRSPHASRTIGNKVTTAQQATQWHTTTYGTRLGCTIYGTYNHMMEPKVGTKAIMKRTKEMKINI